MPILLLLLYNTHSSATSPFLPFYPIANLRLGLNDLF